MTDQENQPARVIWIPRCKNGHELQERIEEQKDELAARAQTVRFQVKRGASVQLLDGRVLRGLEEVTAKDVGGWQEIEVGILRGCVSEIPEPLVRARNSVRGERRYQVNPSRRGGVIAKDGRILEPGEFCGPEDFATQEYEPARPAVAAHVDPQTGRVVPARDAVPERPAITGEDVAEGLVRRGVLVRVSPEEKKSA